MSHQFSTDNFREIADEFERFLVWLKENDIEIGPTRVGVYKRKIDLLADAFDKKTLSQLVDRVDHSEILNTHYEIREVLDIYEGLEKIELTHEIKKRLKVYCSGPTAVRSEYKNSAHPRDIGFELYIGSRLIVAGMPVVDFREDSDVFFSLNNQGYYIECKRPSNEKKVERHISKAFKQLEKKYLEDRDARGLIAISINKIVNRDQKILRLPTITEIDAELASTVKNFIRRSEHLWQGRSNENTIGIIVLLQTLCHSAKDELLITGRQMTINNMTLPDEEIDSNHGLLMRVVEQIKSSFSN